jgi:oxygen-independent coproporphyrinogen III oxidase
VTPAMENAGLYVHVPFCLRKCAYCDFYSITDLSAVSRFVNAVVDETAMVDKPDILFDTLYFGGGTPSLLEPSHIHTLVANFQKVFNLASGSEITMEANPGTVSLKKFMGYRVAGVNRIHIGVQSFGDKNLRILGRIHTAADAVKAIRQARSTGFDNLGIDLIYGLPRQTGVLWVEELKRAVAFSPEHLSCYMLTLEPGTPLYKESMTGNFSALSETGVRELYETTVEFLEENGYDQYEVSNFTRRQNSHNGGDIINDSPHYSWKSRHNGKYWSGATYLGFGPSAHSFISPVRHWNVDNLKGYLQHIKDGRLPIGGIETLTEEQQIIETIYLGFRTTGGIDINKFEERFEANFQKTFDAVLAPLIDEMLVELLPGRCRLTRKGMIFLDSVAGRFVASL